MILSDFTDVWLDLSGFVFLCGLVSFGVICTFYLCLSMFYVVILV